MTAWYCPTAEKGVHKNWVFLLGEEGVLGGARGGPAPISPPCPPPPAVSPGPGWLEQAWVWQVIVVLQDPLFFLVPLALTPTLDSIVLRVPEQEAWPYLGGVLGTNGKEQTFPPFAAVWALKGKATREMDKVVTENPWLPTADPEPALHRIWGEMLDISAACRSLNTHTSFNPLNNSKQ